MSCFAKDCSDGSELFTQDDDATIRATNSNEEEGGNIVSILKLTPPTKSPGEW
jgi:hypothetical protein